MATMEYQMRQTLPAPRLPIGKLAIFAIVIVIVAVCLHAALRHPDTAQKAHDCFEKSPENVILNMFDITHGNRNSYCQLAPDVFAMCAYDIQTGREITCFITKYRSVQEILTGTRDRAFQIIWDAVKGWIPAGGG